MQPRTIEEITIKHISTMLTRSDAEFTYNLTTLFDGEPALLDETVKVFVIDCRRQQHSFVRGVVPLLGRHQL